MKIYTHPVPIGAVVLGLALAIGSYFVPASDDPNWQVVPSLMRLAGLVLASGLAVAMVAGYLGFHSKRPLFMDEATLYAMVKRHFWNGAALIIAALAIGVLVDFNREFGAWPFVIPTIIGGYGLYLLAGRAIYWRALGDRD